MPFAFFPYNDTPNPSHGGKTKLMWFNTHMMDVLHWKNEQGFKEVHRRNMSCPKALMVVWYIMDETLGQFTKYM
jgi:hypothetical protein